MSLQERATVQNPTTSAFKGAAAFNAVSLTWYGIKCFLLEASRQKILAKDIFSENHLIKKQIPKRKKMFDAVKLICTRVCVRTSMSAQDREELPAHAFYPIVKEWCLHTFLCFSNSM